MRQAPLSYRFALTLLSCLTVLKGNLSQASELLHLGGGQRECDPTTSSEPAHQPASIRGFGGDSLRHLHGQAQNAQALLRLKTREDLVAHPEIRMAVMGGLLRPGEGKINFASLVDIHESSLALDRFLDLRDIDLLHLHHRPHRPLRRLLIG